MNIIFEDKPSPFDIRNISRIWFIKNLVWFEIAGVSGVQSHKMSEIRYILSNDEYAKTGRAEQ